jgi:UDP-N-acetylmuramate--alanine ligase
MGEFARAFNEAEIVAVCDVYAAGEDAIEGITSARLVEEMRAQGHRGALYVPKRADIAGVLLPRLRDGDIFITLGAGDVWQAGEDILSGLRVDVASG